MDVEPVERADRVDDGVLRRQLEHDGDVAELQVGVDQHDRPVARALGQDDRQVGGQHRLAGPALGGEHRDDLAQLGPVDGHGDPVGSPLAGAPGPPRGPADHAGHGAASCSASTGAARTSFTPDSQRGLEQLGGELVGDQDGAHLPVRLQDGADFGQPRRRWRYDGPSTRTMGSPLQTGLRARRRSSTAAARSPSCDGQLVAHRRVVVEDGHRHEVQRVGSDWGWSLSQHGWMGALRCRSDLRLRPPVRAVGGELAVGLARESSVECPAAAMPPAGSPWPRASGRTATPSTEAICCAASLRDSEGDEPRGGGRGGGAVSVGGRRLTGLELAGLPHRQHLHLLAAAPGRAGRTRRRHRRRAHRRPRRHLSWWWW